jgi:signal transduction histidine kinase/FixJ family two-component response regulator
MATPLNLLIAEDSPDDVELLLAQLRRHGFDPAWRRVETEPDFLAELKKLPDIVLSDYQMPQFNGLRAAQLTSESGLNIPFILISGTIGEDAAVEAMKQGASDYLLKDRIARLGQAVEQALQRKRLQDERRHTTEELLWKTALLEAQLESSLDGILVVDSQGKKVLQNRRMEEMWKLPRTGGADETDVSKTVFDPAREKYPQQFIEKVAYLQAHPDEAGHDVIELIDGTVLDRYSAPVRNQAGKYYGRIWSFRDITERRKLEVQFRQAQKMESIGQLAGGIAHDFNNILGAILGNLSVAQQEAAGQPHLLEYLHQISLASRRASDLVRQILLFSRQNKPEREPVRLNHVVLEALKLLRASVPASIRIQTDLASTPTVLANTSAIHQVVMNLGTNAWHAMRDQPGVLKVELNTLEVDADFARTHHGLRPGQYVRLSVSDTGHGMDAATMERIFDPFFTTKAVGEGTGLGLAVVLGILQSHDGVITVCSEPGQGTSFHLYFPVFETAEAAPETVSSPVPVGHGEHILFVDDEVALTSIGKKMLERLGYRVTIKNSPTDALAAVREQPDAFDLVITDMTMPVMDGAKLGGQLLQIQPRLPIILTTGYSLVMTEEKVRELGFRELLVKPVPTRALADAVQRALHSSASSRDLANPMT